MRVLVLLAVVGAICASPLPVHLENPNIVVDVFVEHVKGILSQALTQEVREKHSVDSDTRVVNTVTAVNVNGHADAAADFPSKPVGLYISPCLNFTQRAGPRTVYLSATTVRRFGSDGSMQIDETEYIGDPNCNPSQSDTFAKFQLSGQITMRGKNAAVGFPPNTQRVSYQVTNGTYFFPKTLFDAPYIQEANANCPCGGTWVGGVPRSIAASQCNTPPPTASDFCQIITGQVLYGSLLFVNPTDYIVSQSDYDDRIGWTNPLNKTFIFHGASESGDTTPSDCDYVKWSSCGPGVQSAASACDTCSGLECDGCIYRLLPVDAGETDWDECCPCIHYYAQRYSVPWMNIPC